MKKTKEICRNIKHVLKNVCSSSYKRIILFALGAYSIALVGIIYLGIVIIFNMQSNFLTRDEAFLYLKISLLCLLSVFVVFCLFIRKLIIPIINADKVSQFVEHNRNFIERKQGESELTSLNTIITTLNAIMEREKISLTEKKQAEFKALQSQIDPHFLYNTLDSIRGQAVKDNYFEIADMIEALSNMFRYAISQKQNILTFEQELKNVNNYLKIQQFRFDNKFEFLLDVDKSDAEIMSYRLPKLTLQPIIENAISHGLETKEGKGAIVLKAHTTQSRFVISIEDNGIGMDKYQTQALNDRFKSASDSASQLESNKKTSIALENINERIQFYFGKRFGLAVMSTLGVGTQIVITLPKLESLNEN